MKIVSILAANDDPDVVRAHLAFHLSAGVDLVIAAAGGAVEETREVLDSYVRTEQLELVPAESEAGAGSRTDMARRAVADHGADWVDLERRRRVLVAARREPPRRARGDPRPLSGRTGPRPRVPPSGRDGEFAERLTIRPSLEVPRVHEPTPLERALRPVYRAYPELAIEPGDGTANGRRVPLRAWYPIEVLRFPFRSKEQVERRYSSAGARHEPRSATEEELLAAGRDGSLAEAYAKLESDEDATQVGLAERFLAEDVRLRDALRSLRTSSQEGGFELKPIELKPPGIVDDAAYAVECAAVGEVDLVRLDRHIRELEARIGVLEARFWPRVARTLSRAVRR